MSTSLSFLVHPLVPHNELLRHLPFLSLYLRLILHTPLHYQIPLLSPHVLTYSLLLLQLSLYNHLELDFLLIQLFPLYCMLVYPKVLLHFHHKLLLYPLSPLEFLEPQLEYLDAIDYFQLIFLILHLLPQHCINPLYDNHLLVLVYTPVLFY